MKKLASLAIVGSVMLLGICGTAHAQTGKRNLAQEETNRTLVLEFYDTFFR